MLGVEYKGTVPPYSILVIYMTYMYVQYKLWQITIIIMKTVILSWLQNDGNTGFSKDQLKGKKLSPTFWPDALVVFGAKLARDKTLGKARHLTIPQWFHWFLVAFFFRWGGWKSAISGTFSLSAISAGSENSETLSLTPRCRFRELGDSKLDSKRTQVPINALFTSWLLSNP